MFMGILLSVNELVSAGKVPISGCDNNGSVSLVSAECGSGRPAKVCFDPPALGLCVLMIHGDSVNPMGMVEGFVHFAGCEGARPDADIGHDSVGGFYSGFHPSLVPYHTVVGMHLKRAWHTVKKLEKPVL